MDAINVEQLTKSFKPDWPWRPSVLALSGLSLSVMRGEIYGFLGPNGAGKTTTLKILLGLTKASSGRAEVFGKAVGDVETRRRIGFLPESPYFYDYLTAEEFLSFYGHLAGMAGSRLDERIQYLLKLLGLSDAKSRQLRAFSKGMLQRVGLAQALIHDPELVILDEPMSGLDPIGRKQVRDLILSLRDEGKTVFFSTHIIPDVEMICDRVGIIVKGRLLASGRVEDLVDQTELGTIEIVCEWVKPEGIAEMRASFERVLERGRQILITVSSEDRLVDVLGMMRRHGGRLVSVVPHKPSLEELFLRQTVAAGPDAQPEVVA